MMNYYNNFSTMMGGFGTGATTRPTLAMFLVLLAFIAVIIFWLWLLVDCSRRKFNNNYEKAAWILAMFLGTPAPIASSIVYLVVIKLNNKQGILTA